MSRYYVDVVDTVTKEIKQHHGPLSIRKADALRLDLYYDLPMSQAVYITEENKQKG